MQALVKYEKGIGRMELRDVPIPEIEDNEVLVQIKTCGICGTDLKIYDDLFINDPPVIVGHEFAGLIVRTGRKVTGWEIGTRVVAEQHFHSCGMCEYCLTGHRQFCSHKRSPGYLSDGAFTGYIAVEASLLHQIPNEVDFKQAALVEPMAVAAYGILGKAGVKPGDIVVILGAGPIALLALQLVKSAGAAVVFITGIDVDERKRFKAAAELGADYTVNAQKNDAVGMVVDRTKGRGADLVIDLTGSPPAIMDGLRMLRKNGRFCALGLPCNPVTIPWADTVLRAVTVYYSYSSDYTSWETCLAMIRCGEVKLEKFTDQIFPLSSWEQAFSTARSGNALKVIIQP
ncbi:MAG: alcohol dehydrogenase catalytic domain-containing protein [Spirochaetales bacterium]|nr:alcohol dehydrogenase catalytic domain-containing protein [Spirochaetales bacterium]